MIERSYRGILVALATLSLLVTPLSLIPGPASASASTGAIVPLYAYPGSSWDSVIQAKKAHPSVPLVAVVNPSNGPGTSFDANFATGIQNLRSVGVTVLGYVYTGYGARISSSVTADIDAYKTHYNVDGIFFDEMSNLAGKEDYYRSLSQYAKSKGYALTVGNPGADTQPSYIGTVDTIITYENLGFPTVSTLGGWHTNYDKKNFGLLSYGQTILDKSFVSSAASYVGYIYLTNAVLPNPWGSVATYLEEMVAALDNVAASPKTVLLNIGSTGLLGQQSSGLWTTIQTGGSTVAAGYTTLSYAATSGTSYTVTVADYGNLLFDHWEDGATNRYRAITPFTDTVLKAYYKSTSQPI